MTSGLKDLFWNIFGPENRFNEFLEGRASFEDILLPLTELASRIISSVEAITNKFSTTERSLVTEKLIHLYAKLFDYEIFSVNLDEEEIVQIFTSSKYS